MKEHRLHLLVCAGTGCVACNSFEIKEELELEIARQDLEDEIKIVATGCQGFCERGPIIIVQPEGIFYQKITKEDIPNLVTEHLLKGRPVESLMYVPSKKEAPIPKMMDIGFFKHQRLIVLRNRGRLDPENIDEYIGFDGYRALEKALTGLSPDGIIEEIKKSGLRGRGGAGFPTGLKWEFCRKAKGDIKYIVCNGDEGDPGAFMDRSVLEADPHSVLEGMLIGARAMGAQKGYIYVRSEYPLAIKRLNIAIEQAKAYGLIGKNILGTDFDFEIEIFPGAGAFVCGEETALLASIEGNVGRPRTRPPYPAEKGLWGSPTTINNVETWANIAPIIFKGSEWYASIGTETSKGTKIFSLVGKINNTGLVEVPMGITLREIIFDIGGGIAKKKKFKAVQTGGPSGGCIPEELLDLPIDYDSLAKAGSIMGSGGMIVMDQDTCIVDLAKYFLNFTVQESCGKCTPCRVGTRHMAEILEKICNGEGEPADLEKLEFLANTVKSTSLCGLGQTAPNPVLTTLKYFRKEYEEHVIDKRCEALICKDLIEYSVIKDKCTGCQRCVSVCPTGAITGPRSEAHNVDNAKCVKCRACYEICRFDAIAGDAIRIHAREE
ncbi:MAG: NADH-quinone oxidoreductase subunit NuoF [bacterium]|nr:NADH-quinone oxidoreductase subunit NuoF [bacterium]